MSGYSRGTTTRADWEMRMMGANGQEAGAQLNQCSETQAEERGAVHPLGLFFLVQGLRDHAIIYQELLVTLA